MIQKVLAWSALALALVFVVLSLAIMFAGDALGPSSLTVVAPMAIGSVAISILLAVTMLVMALVQ